MGAVGCFDRIHTFLKTEARVDPRARPIESSSKLGSEVSSTFEKGSGLDSLHEVKQPLERIKELVLSDTTAVAMHNGSFGWDKEKDPILRNIDFKAQREQLTAIIGPVGCGKSTLLQAILGEVHTFEGSVQVASQECGYCQQTPWLMNGTICQSIIGISDFDQHWYSTVIRACALEQDLRQMPSGDKSLIGSRGITLSGGQAQRVVSRLTHRLSASVHILTTYLNRHWQEQSMLGKI